MAFASRKEDGVWRLCKRMGATFSHIHRGFWPDIEIVFPSQAKAKACADELNESCWKQYDTKEKPDAHGALLSPMVAIIHKHQGITDAQYEAMK